MRALGAQCRASTPMARWRVDGRGIGGLAEPADVLDLGNAGTGARLLLGLLATHPITAFLTGDALAARAGRWRAWPRPCAQMGATHSSRATAAACRWPSPAPGEPLPITYRLPVASAQVKSAVLLAGLEHAGRNLR